MRITDEELARRYSSALDNEDWELASALQELIDHRDETGDYHPETNEWEDHRPEPTAPWLMDPGKLVAQLERLATEAHLQWLTRDPGNPTVFYRDLTRDPLTPETRALIGDWQENPPPPPEHWQPAIRLCSERGKPEGYIGGIPYVTDYRVPPGDIAWSYTPHVALGQHFIFNRRDLLS